MPSIFAAPNTNKVCYMILPEGIMEDLDEGLKELAGNSPILPRLERAFEVVYG